MWSSCDAAATRLEELRTKEQALNATAAELAERQAELQTQEVAVRSAQASLDAQEEQLALKQQACSLNMSFAKSHLLEPLSPDTHTCRIGATSLSGWCC